MPFPKEHMDTLVFSVVPLAVCYFSDLLLSRVHGKFTSALLDNASHGLVAFTIWMAGASTASSWQERVVSATCAAAIACAMDADHFLMAGSLHLHDATHLRSRPPAHALLFVALVGVAAYVAGLHFSGALAVRFALIAVTGVLSHQIKDGWRRGLWLWPLASTPPIAYPLYLLLDGILLPLSLSYLLAHTPPTTRHYSSSFLTVV